MSITFDTKIIDLEIVYNNALAEFETAKFEVLIADIKYSDANAKFDAANISKEGIADAVNIVYPDADACDKAPDSTVVTPYVSAVAIGYFRAKKAHDGAHDNLYLATERLESAIDAYNTHVTSKYGKDAITVPLPGTIFNGEPYLVFHGSVDDRLIGIPAGDAQIHNLYDSDDVCILPRDESKEGMMPSYTYVIKS
jgi:hypothetical protein